jgi:hypothetical protein
MSTGTRITKTIYRALTACVIKENVKSQFQGQKLDSSEWPGPRELDKDKTRDDFSVWSLVFGKNSVSKRYKDVAIASPKAKKFKWKARFGFASAMFSSKHNDLWHMDWRSRLIRFRLPGSGSDSDSDSGFGSNCKAPFKQVCKKAGGFIGKLKDLDEKLIIH